MAQTTAEIWRIVPVKAGTGGYRLQARKARSALHGRGRMSLTYMSSRFILLFSIVTVVLLLASCFFAIYFAFIIAVYVLSL